MGGEGGCRSPVSKRSFGFIGFRFFFSFFGVQGLGLLVLGFRVAEPGADMTFKLFL